MMGQQPQDPMAVLAGVGPQSAQTAGAPSAPQDPMQALAGVGPQSPGGTGDASAMPATPQQSGPMRYVDKLGSDLVSGATGALGLPGTLVQAAKKAALAHGVSEAAWNSTIGNLLDTQQMNAGADAAGNALGVGPVVNRPDLAPQNAAERYGDAAVKALPAAAATITSGGAALPALLGSTGGAVAGQGAQDAGLPWYAQLGASLLGGGAGGAAASALSPQNVERVASTLGTSSTMQQAGSKLQSAARDWINNVMPAQQEAAWGHVNDIMADAPVPLNTTLSNLKDLVPDQTQPLGGATAALKGNQFSNLLDKIIPPDVAAKLPNADEIPDTFRNWSPANPPSWQQVKQFRSTVGDILGQPTMMKGMNEGDLQHLYAGLTDDMRTAADGRALGAEFDNANAENVRLNDIKANVMSKLVAGGEASRADPKPGEAATAVLRGAQHDGTTLQTLRDELPDATDELAAAHLRMFSPKYAKLNPQGSAPASLSPEAMQALVPDPSTRALITSVIPTPAPRSIIGHGGESLASGLFASLLEQGLNTGLGHEGQVGAALLGAGLPYGIRGLKAVGATPGILPGAALGAAAGGPAQLGVTGQ